MQYSKYYTMRLAEPKNAELKIQRVDCKVTDSQLCRGSATQFKSQLYSKTRTIFKSIMLSEESQTNRKACIIWFHLQEMSRRGKSIQVKSRYSSLPLSKGEMLQDSQEKPETSYIHKTSYIKNHTYINLIHKTYIHPCFSLYTHTYDKV